MNTTTKLLDASDAARLLLLSDRRIRALAHEKKIPHIVLPDGDIRFDPADLASWVCSIKRPAEKGVRHE